MNRWRLAILLFFLVLVVPLLAADNSNDEFERNARLLATWKKDDHEHYARLQRDAQAFAALSPERQQKLRQLDHDLRDCDPETQQRLWETLERYTTWLDQLPEAERQQIVAIADHQERIKAIKAKREQQWLEHLPATDRDYLKNLPEEQQPAAIAKLHQEDDQRRQKWQNALKLRPDLRPRPQKPSKLEDFPVEVTAFVNELLTPMLDKSEKEQLKTTRGWPALAQLILELSDKHPVLPPPLDNPEGVRHYDQLPQDVRNSLGKQGRGQFKQQSGRWPDYALAVTEHVSGRMKMSRPFGACKPGEFPAEAEVYIKETLLKAITPEEAQQLGRTEGQWPAYPKLLHELAKKYKLVIPGMSLPGPSEFWDRARLAALPEVPDHELRAFLNELSHEERRTLNLSPTDPLARDRIRQAYFQRRPGELKRLHDLEPHKGEPKRMPPD